MKAAVAMMLLSAAALSTPSSALTPDQVATGFIDAVKVCARSAIVGVPISQLPESDRAGLLPGKPDLLALGGFPDGRPVYDVLSAKGIVQIGEPKGGECIVLAYGPPVRPVFADTARILTAEDFGFSETRNTETPSDILRDLEQPRGADGKAKVHLVGGEPGMQGRRFRFPMLDATVTWSSAPTAP